MNVLLLSRYSWEGNSSRHRTLKFIPFLEKENFKITVAPLMGDGYVRDLYNGRSADWPGVLRAYARRLRDLLSSRSFNVIWIERETLPYLPAIPEWCLNHLGIPYVIDYDDAIFHNYDQHPSWIVRSLLGGKIDSVMRNARLVVAGNDYIADRARKAGARWIERVPTVVDLRPINPDVEAKNNVFTIGWIGSPLNARYVQRIATALAEVCKNDRGRLVMVGARDFRVEKVPLTLRQWSEDTEVAEIQSFDVGIMPLPDDPFERGKCGFKLLQYFACARAGVASPVGVNAKIIERGVNGFLASTTAEWIEALTCLREDRDLRKRMGAAGRKKVEDEYSLERTAPRIATLLRQAAQKRGD